MKSFAAGRLSYNMTKNYRTGIFVPCTLTSKPACAEFLNNLDRLRDIGGVRQLTGRLGIGILAVIFLA
jgi:hypothetical protein